jgi:predicted DNA-binding protein (UPF0251 family)
MMTRPVKFRRVCCLPDANYFKPRGIPLRILEEIVLTVDEFEAVRLADFAGLYQKQAAARMHVSRQTFGNIIGSAHKKIADAIVNGKALKIAGGSVKVSRGRAVVRSGCPTGRNSIDRCCRTGKNKFMEVVK